MNELEVRYAQLVRIQALVVQIAAAKTEAERNEIISELLEMIGIDMRALSYQMEHEARLDLEG